MLMHRGPLALWTLALLLVSCGGSGPEAAGSDAALEAEATPPPPAVRQRLFDGMDRARWTMPPAPPSNRITGARTETFDNTQGPADGVWFAEPNGRTLRWLDTGATVDPEVGRDGGSLRLGPGIDTDYSRAVLVVPVHGRTLVQVEARVRVEGHPSDEPSSYREALRLYEHRGAAVTDPTTGLNVDGERARRRMLDRVVRRVDPSGWARVDAEAVTRVEAKTVEVHLLHRTGGSGDTTSWFDDVVVRTTPLDESAYLDRIVSRYQPRDGQEAQTPWRLRVELRSETRDCVIVPTAGELALDVAIPPAESKPMLRFGLGALPQTARERGDGTRMSVVFLEDGAETTLAVHELDPKNDSKQRAWMETTVDLLPVAGRRGALAFRVSDVDQTPDELDALLLATPRIEPAGEAPSAPNILLIGVDTLRADHLSAFGYDRDTTPNLKALADEGVRFTMARSPAPWTLPSFSSMLTSLYPTAHGAGRGGHDEWEAIDPTTVSVAEILARNGYETAGIVANGLISPRYGLDQGFDRYRAAWAMESVDQDAPRVSEFVESHTRTPWLMFWHIMDPHLPYMTGEEERAAFTEEGYDGRFRASDRGVPTVPFNVLDPRPGRRWYAHEGPPPAPELSEQDTRFVSDYYDAEIREVDAGIGQVIESLRATGQLDRTIIAFVADHGEGLGDHGHYHHGYTLFDDQVHVPLLVRFPDAHKGVTIDRPVSTVDLVPTLLGALGISALPAMHGRDRLSPDAPAVDATFIEYPTYDSSAQKAWVEGRFKYLWDPLYHTEALYDFVADPRETTDVRDDHPEVVARAREALSEFRVEHLSAGRFYLRLRGEEGQRLRLKVTTNDLFDANFVTRPAVDEQHFEMNLDRTYLSLDTVLEDGRLELRFWCRGSNLTVEATLDDRPLDRLVVGEGSGLTLPAGVARTSIPTRAAEDIGWPEVDHAQLWLEEGASAPLAVINTPEEAERLRELGYGH